MTDRAGFRPGDWGKGIETPFDLILCNPPYIATGEALMPDVADHEPAAALFAGADGLDAYRRIVPDLPRLLAPGGAAILEIGATQHISIAAQIGRAHVRTPVTNANIVCLHLPEKKKETKHKNNK